MRDFFLKERAYKVSIIFKARKERRNIEKKTDFRIPPDMKKVLNIRRKN